MRANPINSSRGRFEASVLPAAPAVINTDAYPARPPIEIVDSGELTPGSAIPAGACNLLLSSPRLCFDGPAWAG
jgi:hypothetical protein